MHRTIIECTASHPPICLAHNHMTNGIQQCSQCRQPVHKNKLFVVDDGHICPRCMYGNTEPFEIYPIGIVRNNLKRRGPNFRTTGKAITSRIQLMPSQKPFMYKVEDEKFLTIVYYLHQSQTVRSIFDRGLDGKKVGVFASRTPDRLSRIGIQDVRLISVEDTNLYVKGLDAIDGSPVLDIKLSWNLMARLKHLFWRGKRRSWS